MLIPVVTVLFAFSNRRVNIEIDILFVQRLFALNTYWFNLGRAFQHCTTILLKLQIAKKLSGFLYDTELKNIRFEKWRAGHHSQIEKESLRFHLALEFTKS